VNNSLPFSVNEAKPPGCRLGPERTQAALRLDEYLRTKVLETGDRVLGRTSIYLDTCYWIRLRDAFMGRNGNDVFVKLLVKLRSAVRDGKAICPFAADLFAEVMKQSADCRMANLIDELSQGIALQPEHERVATEILYCFWRSHGVTALEPLSRLVWTTSSYVLGFTFPSISCLGADDELSVQKGFTDHMWNLGFARQMAALSDWPERLNPDYASLAEKLNILNAAHSKNLRSFKQIHVVEFAGILEFYLPQIIDIWPYLHEQKHRTPAPKSKAAEFKKSGRMWMTRLQECFRRNKLGEQLPTLVIRSGLAAALRWNRKRRYEANDFHDFGHAAAALVHFDMFATERSLHHLITTELKYDRKYKTTVYSEPSRVLAAVAGIK